MSKSIINNKPEIVQLPITRGNLRNVFAALKQMQVDDPAINVDAGITLTELCGYFGIRAYERKKLNRLEDTIEAERKKGFLELTGANKYRPVGDYNEPTDKQSD